jgi:5-methylcytosine-specific restriction protein A
MSRSFSAKVQAQATVRADGKCEECGGQLKPGQIHFHHRKPVWKGGDNSLENCKVLCTADHLAADEDHDFDNMHKADKKGKATEKLPVAAGESEIARRFRRP